MSMRAASAMLGLALLLGSTAAPLAQQSVPEAANGATEAAAALSEPFTKPQVREIVSQMSDDEVRTVLIAHLDKAAVTAEATTDVSTVDEIMSAGDRASDRLRVVLGSSSDLGQTLREAWSTFTGDGRTQVMRIVLAIVLAIVATWLAERVFARLTASLAPREPDRDAPSHLGRCGLLLLRALFDLLGLAAGLLGAAAALFLVLAGNEAAPQVLLRIIGAIAFIRAVAAVSRAVLAPRASWLRATPVGDAVARGVHSRIVTFATLWIGLGLPDQTLAQLDAKPEVVGLVGLVAASVLIVGLIAMVFQAREPMAAFIRGRPPGESSADRTVEVLASRWHVLASAYLVVLFVLAVAVKLSTGKDIEGPAIASLLLLFALPVADGTLRALCAWVSTRNQQGPAAGEGASGDLVAAGVEDTRPALTAFEHALVRNGRIILGLIFFLAFAGIWDLNLLQAAEGVVGGRLAGSLVEILITLVLAYAVWSLVKAAVEQVVPEKEDAGDEAEGEIGGPGASRVATLLPLLKKVVAIALGVMVALIVLSALGVNIGPLIAGAGVLGLAVGFGAQTLVKDVISGFFFLLDDAFRMGEYVEVDAIRGSVERISVRSLQLRHHNGPVHTLPFGDIRHITNYSRDWAIMKFEIRLPYDTDIDKLRKVIKRVGQDMIDNEAFKDVMLQPLKSQGVNRMDDSALIVRCKFTAKPGEQFVLRREAYTRIQEALADEGIQFAPRRVIVETSSGGSPTRAEREAAAGSVDSQPPAAQAPT